ncbi:molybdopterin-dependent oxidoreductase [Marinobacter szutsaonensis]
MKNLTFIALFLATFLPVIAQAAPELVVRSGSKVLVLDRDELETFPQTTVTTSSPYYDGTVEFTGPTLKRVLDTFGLGDQTQLTFRALNDYQVKGTLAELLDLDAIIATRMDGRSMSVRNRGPFWIILPLSERPELDHGDYHRFMVWQLDQIELN